jgi:hypothetical protein
MAESNKIPLVGLFTGAQTLYAPLHHWVVNVRASYFDETREQVSGLWNTLGYKKIGVIYPDDPFGAAVLESVKTALKGTALKRSQRRPIRDRPVKWERRLTR